METQELRQRVNDSVSNVSHNAATPKQIGGPPAEGASLLKQLYIMLKRNFTLLLRYRKSTLLQIIIAPLLLQLMLFALQKIDNYRQGLGDSHPSTSLMGGVMQCQGKRLGDPCISLLYTPDNEQTRQILGQFAAKNKERTGQLWPVESTSIDLNEMPKGVKGMVPVSNAEFIYQYALRHPNVTSFGIEFNILPGPPANYRYQLWYNNTLYNDDNNGYNTQIHRLMRGIDEAIISTVNNNDPADIKVSTKSWPVVPTDGENEQLISRFGVMFSFCTEMIIFIASLNMIVTEKEHKLRESMAMMGLNAEIYWLSWFLAYAVPVIICAIVTCLLGLAFGFEVYNYTNFGVLVITFILFGMAMLSLGFFLSTLVRRVRVAVIGGIFIFLIGLLFESLVFSNAAIGYIWWQRTTTPRARQALVILPFFNFGKIYLDISRYTAGIRNPITGVYTEGVGFSWSTLYKNIPSDISFVNGSTVPAPVYSWYMLLMNIGVYLLATWYFDKVIPSEFGQRRPLWFFLMPSYWGLTHRSAGQIDHSLLKPAQESIENEDEDVRLERTIATDLSIASAIRVLGLRKLYHNSLFRRSSKDKVAVQNLSLALREGELFALLGQNGAGKSTTMNILSGLTPPTRGDAYVYGFSVRHQMSQIRRILGVCPQHDLLFNDLSAVEHIALYAGLKGVPNADIHALTEERLQAVRLWEVRHKPARTYSGGMKRRLSVIIATLGDPKVIFLDEPTTGMDPVNRRHVWRFLESFKQGRIIILTTHSMEEADVLGDRIAIMALGKLRALGTSIHLKNRFGFGYRITLVVEPHDADSVHHDIQERMPGVVLADNSAGALIYQCSPREMPRMPEFLRYLESRTNPLIRSWGVSQTTLEEVFLLLVRQAMEEAKTGTQIEDNKRK
ncbi:hypothetical protein BDF22DRAFT_683893 [Syncephalis plumigaleata]|nr:hypothetical protein BDF22DRAFT_683893 [Syncephalis plumigaleata]